jgi:hypothetical protein
MWTLLFRAQFYTLHWGNHSWGKGSNTVWTFTSTNPSSDSLMSTKMKKFLDRIWTNVQFLWKIKLKLITMWKQSKDIHVYILHHAIPWFVPSHKSPLIKFWSINNYCNQNRSWMLYDSTVWIFTPMDLMSRSTFRYVI